MGGEASGMSAAEAASMLGWWLEAGVDVAVQDEPRNWLDSKNSDAAAPAPAPAPAAPLPQGESPDQQLPESFDLFRQWLGTASTLPQADIGGRRILPRGAEGAPIMLLADAPAGAESADGRPIGGESWELTERMLAAIGISAENAYCANISCFHAPGTRMSPEEIQACAAIARRHVALARPERLLLLGDGPAQALLGKPVATARAHVHMIEGIRSVATFHPRFLVNRPSNKSLAWKDLLLLMEDAP